MRFLMGLFLAASLIMFEIGVAEILLARDGRCREMAAASRLAQDPDDVCLSQGGLGFLQVLSRGFYAFSGESASSALAWAVTGGVYALLGGFLAQFSYRLSVGIFLILHIFAIAVLSFLTYISPFVVF
jgi:hypothetical protein